MAVIKISQLPAIATPALSDLYVSVQGGVTYNGTLTQLQSLISFPTPANSAMLVTTSAGATAWTSTMTNGQVVIGSTGATPTAATLTAGNNISITNGAHSITVAGSLTPTLTNVTFSPTTGGIVGTTTNNNASAGTVGELISSTIAFGSAISISTATPKDLTSISLTAGDWNVWGNIGYNPSGNLTQWYAWISSTSATLPDLSLANATSVSAGSTGFQGISAPTLRLSLASTTTIYLSGNVVISSGTCTFFGGIYARRVR